MNLLKAFGSLPTPLINYAPEGLGGGFNTTKQPADPSAISAITRDIAADTGLSNIAEIGGYDSAQPA